MAARFDAYVMVDWSANQSPKRGADSIWWSDGRTTSNPPTRAQAVDELRAVLSAAVAAGRRVLVGFDFPLSYPRGFARALGLSGAPWRATWDLLASLIRDEQRAGVNNRFEVAGALNRRLGGRGPFWGCPPGRRVPGLSARLVRAAPLPEKKLSERCVAGPQPPWKLLGVGTVGGQALLGIPCVRQLRDDPGLAAHARVWPFETQGEAPIVLAEIYPSMRRVVPRSGQVRDEAQVLNLARWFRALDRRGELEALLRVPWQLGGEDRRAVLEEEGWILGVTRTTPLR